MITIVTALLCEAKPIISKFNLKRVNDIDHYPVYLNDEITLIVSGIGKSATAGACGFFYGHSRSDAKASNRSPITSWLNIGLAGHSDLDIGKGFLAHRIIDNATDKTWYPSIIFKAPCHTDNLLTVDRANADYSHQGGIDMEASGFYATACRFSTSELVHSFKVVSDNPSAPLKKFSKNDASDLIEKNIETIHTLIEQLKTLQISLPQPFSDQQGLNNDYDKILSLHHFTHTEKLQLQNQLRRLSLLNDQSSLMINSTANLDKSSSAKEFLKELNQLINQQPITFD